MRGLFGGLRYVCMHGWLRCFGGKEFAFTEFFSELRSTTRKVQLVVPACFFLRRQACNAFHHRT